MTEQEKIQRGIEARALLEAPLIMEAFDAFEKESVDKLAATDGTQCVEREAYIERITALRAFKQHLRSTATTGREAELKARAGRLE